ncbi:MAG: glycolate utilization protein [Methylophilales bacterium 16-45-7]|nr:MAG: glycolate utilization protein [Methylophilales bacterium 16-45-7]
MHVSFDEAQQIVDSAVKKSVELGVKMCIAVLDSGGNIKAFARMDDAWVGSSDIAIKKAKTACYFAMPSGEIGKLSVPGSPLYGIEHSNDGLITFPGGVPMLRVVVNAICQNTHGEHSLKLALHHVALNFKKAS